MAVTKTIYMDDDAIVKRLVEKIAAYWNGKKIRATYTGARTPEWSDGDENGNRVPGTHDMIESIVGTISAKASGTNLEIEIEYEVTIQNVG
jgi:hypothetical protein